MYVVVLKKVGWLQVTLVTWVEKRGWLQVTSVTDIKEAYG